MQRPTLGVLPLLCATACAAAPATARLDGVEVSRLTLSYAGQPYSLQHTGAHPRPRGPSSGLRDTGGRIAGRVCGAEVRYDVEHRGDHIELVGQVADGVASWIEVRDQRRERLLTGAVGGWVVDLHVIAGRLVGRIGPWPVDLAPRGEQMLQALRPAGGPQAVLVLGGRDQLWEMPAADQAALLPLLLPCAHIAALIGQRDAAFGFGGPATTAAHEVTLRLAMAIPDDVDPNSGWVSSKLEMLKGSWMHYTQSMLTRYKGR